MLIWFLVGVLIITLYLLAGLRVVRQYERWTVEFLGKYIGTWKPGLHLLLPGLMRVSGVIDIRDRRVHLFEEPVEINFSDATAKIEGAEVILRIKSPDEAYPTGDGKEMTGVERAVYEIRPPRNRTIRDFLEHMLGSYFRTLTIDKALVSARAGYNLMARMPRAQRNQIIEVLDRWGESITVITLKNFDLPEGLERAREEPHRRAREAEAAAYEREVRAQETMGSLIEMIGVYTGTSPEEVQKTINGDSELQRKLMAFAQELITRRMSIDGRALTDIRVSGGGPLEQAILQIIGAMRARMSQPQRKEE
jgi:regulator of protease activity HflC (stomatin/prohibitin superfamily)